MDFSCAIHRLPEENIGYGTVQGIFEAPSGTKSLGIPSSLRIITPSHCHLLISFGQAVRGRHKPSNTHPNEDISTNHFYQRSRTHKQERFMSSELLQSSLNCPFLSSPLRAAAWHGPPPVAAGAWPPGASRLGAPAAVLHAGPRFQ